METEENQRLDGLTGKRKALFDLLLKNNQMQEIAYQPFSLLSSDDKSKITEDIEDAFPIGAVQTGMLFQMGKARDANMPPDYHNVSTFIFTFEAPFDLELLQTAVSKLVIHEPMFRTSFDLHSYSEPLQLVQKEAYLPISYEDLRNLSAQEQRAALTSWIGRENFNVVNMSEAPLIKLHVHQFSQKRIAFSLKEPHSISDGWSTHLNLLDIFNLYISEQKDSVYELESNSVSYAEFIKHEREAISSEKTRNFWRDALKSCSVLDLPLKAPVQAEVVLGDHRHDKFLPVEILEGLNLVVQKAGVPLKSILLAAHARLLSLLSAQEQVTTGLNFNGRLETKGGTTSRGMFLNILPVTLSIDAESWIELAQQAYEEECRILPYRHYPLGVLQAEYGNKSLFKTAFSFLHFHSVSDDPLAQSEQIVCEEVIDYSKTDFDFNSVFSVYPTGERKLEHKHDANLDRFSPEQLRLYYQCYELILKDISDNPEANPNRLDFITPLKRQELVYEYNSTEKPVTSDLLLHQLFEDQAADTPDAIAVDCLSPVERLSYADLNRLANVCAAQLMEEGIGGGHTVAICLSHSSDVIISILGVLKTGAAYIPLDASVPTARVTEIIESGRCTCVIGKGAAPIHCASKWLDVESVREDSRIFQNPCVDASMNSAAYVIFTSGSTGNPKGVSVSHRGVANYLIWAKQQYQITAADIMPLFTSLGFDLTVTSLFAPLVSGARVRVFPGKNISEQLEKIVKDQDLTLLKITPAHLSLLSAYELRHWQVDRVVVGGEQLNATAAQIFMKKCPLLPAIFNEYGPTEASIGCMFHRFDPLVDTGGSVPIGHPINNMRIYILDYRGLPVLEGTKGELYIAGSGLASGYINDAEETDKVFVDDPFFPGQKMYRSGDLVRRLHDGKVEFISRIDNQTKLRGFRIEMGEVEHQCMKISAVKEAIVSTRSINGEEQLVAYIVPADTKFYDEQVIISDLKAELKKSLPSYMVPKFFAFLEALPITEGGKVNRKDLPSPENYATATSPYEAPRNEIERTLLEIWQTVVFNEAIGVTDNFFEIGGSSLLSFQLAIKMKSQAGLDVSVTDIFEFPTIRAMADFLISEQEHSEQARGEAISTIASPDQPIAIIGMAGRFPEASDIDAIWENLKSGHESLNWYSDEELLEAGVAANLLAHPNYVKAGAPIDNIQEFDAEYFNFTPREAQLMDPQQRLLFEVAVETLDDAGYGDGEKPRNVGVFVGVGEGFYFINNLMPNRDLIERMAAEVQFGNGRDFAATRLSHRLNLSGPAMTVATACSTSLVAIHQAIASLRKGECEMAIAGGAKVGQFGPQGYLYQEGGILSSDGHCRTFDQQASGTRSGDGCGLVLLKRLPDAVRDRDNIHAVIKGSAINNDGSNKMGYTAPSVPGQAEVIREALRDANVLPETVKYIEAHGTGTLLGDPIELKALNRAYGDNPPQSALIGAVKPNIGHLDAAAGIASVIKAVLALKHKQIPPSINFQQANRTIDFINSRFSVNSTLSDWPDTIGPNRAGVSAFGIGGTNAHLILEEAPNSDSTSERDGLFSDHLVMLSAQTPQALQEKKNQLIKVLAHQDQIKLADLAFSLRTGRTDLPYRDYYVSKNVEDLAASLADKSSKVSAATKDVALLMMFPGQGSQYVGAAACLYENESRFAGYFDLCAALFEKEMDVDLRIFIKKESARSTTISESIKLTNYAQAVLFSYSWSLAKVLFEMGLRPEAMIGHSLGEFVAAALAGVISVEQAAKIIAKRGALMREMPQGHMLSVARGATELQSILADTGAELAAENAPNAAVISVSADRLRRLQNRLEQDDIPYRLLETSHGFHSSMMDGAVVPFVDSLAGIQLNSPEIPIVSNLTGDFIDSEICDSTYWGDQLRQPVKFSEGLANIIASQSAKTIILLEVGVGNSLSMLAHKQELGRRATTVSVVPHRGEESDDYVYWLNALGELWKKGAEFDKNKICIDSGQRRISLPSYPFQRKKYWIHADGVTNLPRQGSDPDESSRSTFYERHWRLQSSDIKTHTSYDSAENWLILGDDSSFTKLIGEAISSSSQSVVSVIQGAQFDEIGVGRFVVNPQSDGDYSLLVAALAEQSMLPDNIIHCAGLTAEASAGVEVAFPETELRANQSAVKLMQALLDSMTLEAVKLTLVSANAQRVTGNENINPAASLLNGIATVLPQEYPEVNCQLVDLELSGDDDSSKLRFYAKAIVDEFKCNDRPPRLALRNKSRWLQVFQNTALNKDTPAFSIREGGVYVITGGLGNIGLVLAESLASRFKAKIVLISRRSLPPEERWAEYIEKASPGDSLKAKLQQLLNIRQSANALIIAQADVRNETELEKWFAETEETFGKVDGVIHAAGQVEASMTPFGSLSKAHFSLQYGSKVQGVEVLDKVIAGRTPDFVVLMSSLATILGGLGFTAYAAANSYMDGFVARKHNQAHANWIAINWDGWQFDSSDPAIHAQETFSVSAEQGVSAFYEALSIASSPNVIHSTGCLSQRMDKWVNKKNDSETTDVNQDRPQIETEYTAPSGPIEVRLAEEWKKLLGVKDIGANDNFFQLGGDSLLITRVIATIRQEFKVSDKELSLQALFTNPTIRMLAERIALSQANAPITKKALKDSGKAIEEGGF